ncbi:hypothetical protein F4859DRAFT_368573 [Xylaria cf. heliscus]|nr:hypothetical protein F4859DRAFT_368573 [Xylaria cf. heliscus]
MAILESLLLHKDSCSGSGTGPSLADSRQRSYSIQFSPPSAHGTHYRQQSLPSLNQAMRASLTASPGLVAIPLNALEWKRAIQEVKRKYLARKYRSCSMQCCEILENLKDTSSIEPLHLIYLHFYAASSFEWCARSLSSSSAYRTKLLRSAQEHYTEAEGLIAATGWDITERSRSPSSVSTASLSSPGLSASSRTSDSSSSASSPRTSVISLDDETPAKLARPIRVKPKKKVSFSGLPEFFEFQPEPYVRPDSPTLGWEDHVSPSPSLQELYASFPMSPTRASPTSIMKQPTEGRANHAQMTTATDVEPKPSLKTSSRATTLATQHSGERHSSADQEYSQKRSSTPTNHTFDLESFLQTRSLNRFRERLSALRDQVSRHRVAVESLLSTPDDPPRAATPSTGPDMIASVQQPHGENPLPSPRGCLAPEPAPTPTPTPKATPTDRTSASARPALHIQTDVRDDFPSAQHHLRRYSSASTGFCQTPTSAIAPPLSAGVGGSAEKNLRDRIERLRASGWRRKRFDGRRYEALREQVLGELEPCC